MKMDILPDEYRNIDEEELSLRITAVKKKMNGDLCMLGHYYQRDEVVKFADYQGDSFSLAKFGSETKASFIVFCGVHFMAEASVVLASPGQKVFLPDMDAGCPLADMASIEEVEDAWSQLENANVTKKIIPITYMNSTAALKAFCGKHGGLVCTSSSAGRAFEWAMSQNKNIFFFPDENLGRNTAHSLNIKDGEMIVWDPFATHSKTEGEIFKSAKVILWKGHCHVHTFFTPKHIEEARQKYQGCKIVVHPECNPDVVHLADGNGSTAYLKRYAEDAPKGSTIVIGTEINLVSRLAREHPEKKIVPLARSLCPNMFKISLHDLCWTLENLGQVNEVFVPDDIAQDAKTALDLMLKVGAKS